MVSQAIKFLISFQDRVSQKVWAFGEWFHALVVEGGKRIVGRHLPDNQGARIFTLQEATGVPFSTP
jgi:hypothetical protein